LTEQLLTPNRRYTRQVSEESFPEDPSVPLDEPFVNQAGDILNVLLERFTSVAHIRSNPGAVRGNHYHRTDWHYAYVLSGEIVYGWRPAGSRATPRIRRFTEGQLFFTPPMVEHVMYFPVASSFMTFARNLRDHDSHEDDVVRVTPLLRVAWSAAEGRFTSDINPDAVQACATLADDPVDRRAHRRKSCALCGADVTQRTVLSLPDTPCANEFVDRPRPQDLFPLALQLCPRPDCGHLQLGDVVEPERLYSDYLYVAGTSPAFVRHFADYADTLIERERLGPRSVVVDIGSNDGSLLAQFAARGLRRIHGIEPARAIAAQANERGIPTTNAFFDRGVALDVRRSVGAADVVTANNVFAHIEDLETTTLAVRDLLAPDGILVIEVSYLLDVVEGLLFDTIYHEHLSYHALRPLRAFFGRLGLTLYHAERVATHGGSLRCYISRRPRPVSDDVGRLVRLEERAALFDPETYDAFGERIGEHGARLAKRMGSLHPQRFCGYGAPAKLTTLMYALDLDPRVIEFIVDDSPLKQGRFTPGTHIPVAAADRLAKLSGEGYTCVVFAWNFFDSIVAANGSWMGQWLHPLDPGRTPRQAVAGGPSTS
jgi:SAM-dependent methyltransferase